VYLLGDEWRYNRIFLDVLVYCRVEISNEETVFLNGTRLGRARLGRYVWF